MLVLYGWQILFCHSEFHELDENGFAKRPITKVTYDPRDDDEESSYEEYYEEGSLSWLLACVLVCLFWSVYGWRLFLLACLWMQCLFRYYGRNGLFSVRKMDQMFIWMQW